VEAGLTTREPPFGLTDTGLPGRPGAEIVADVPPAADHERVDEPPEQTGDAEAVNDEITGVCVTVIVMSCTTELQPLVAVRR